MAVSMLVVAALVVKLSTLVIEDLGWRGMQGELVSQVELMMETNPIADVCHYKGWGWGGGVGTYIVCVLL